MLQMSEETKQFLQAFCSDIAVDRAHLKDLLNSLDVLMLDSLDENYAPTEITRPIISAYDDLYYNN